MLLANVAQLVEQFTRNEQVAGSNPAISSKKCSAIVPSIFWCYVFCELVSKIHIMHPVGGEHHAAALRWYDYISPSAFAKHDVSAKADILYLVILGIMYLASARHFL